MERFYVLYTYIHNVCKQKKTNQSNRFVLFLQTRVIEHASTVATKYKEKWGKSYLDDSSTQAVAASVQELGG